MKAIVAQIDAWNGSTPVTLRVSSHDDERVCHLNGQTWWPAIAKLPTLRYDFFDGSFQGAITAPTGELQIQTEPLASLPGLALHDARIRLWRGEIGDAWVSYAPLFDGRVKEQPSIGDGAATFSIGCDDSWLDEPLLGTYAGTSNAEGPAELKGNLKQLLIGAPRFVEGTLVDAANLIYQLSAGQIEGVEMAFDKLNRLGTPAANYSTFAALKAATIAPGTYATCLAQGFARLGAPPDGLVTFHVKGDKAGSRGWVRKPGSIIHRLAELRGALTKVNVASLDALDTACPWNLSIAVSAQTTARDLILAIATSVDAVPVMSWLGVLYLLPVAIGTAQATLAADGSALPPVAAVQQLPIGAPYWRLAQKSEVTQRVHSPNEIAFDVVPYDRGNYDAATSYRYGDVVTMPDGSRWKFVGAAPATGSTPSDANTNWERQTDATTADLPIGTNVVINSELTLLAPGSSTMPLGFQAAWTGDSSNLSGMTIADSRVMLADGSYALSRTQTGGAPNGTAMDIMVQNIVAYRRFLLPVMPGDKLMASALVGTEHALAAVVEIQLLDEAGAYVFEIAGTGVNCNIGSTAFTALTRGDLHLCTMDGWTVLPDGHASLANTKRCRWAFLNVRMILNGQSNVRGVAAAGMMTKVPAAQTSVPIYLPGPSDRAATTNNLYVASSAPSSPNDGDLWKDTSTTPPKFKFRVAGAWIDVSNLVTDTSQIGDGAGLGLSALWTGVTGSGKPEDSATRNTYFVGASDPGGANGSLWKDTSTTPARFRLKVSGSWVDVSSLVTDTAQITDGANLGLTSLWTGVTGSGKPADNATRNDYFVGSSDPGLTNGALWKDTSTTPAKFKLKVSGSWVDVSSLVTDTSQIGDGAGLGLTAVWANVSGSGKPANSATRNDYYIGASDPGGADGSLWKDTSTTPARFRLKVSGSWVDVSSLVTDTAQITDGANLGLTAIWGGVSGSGKPENDADVTSLPLGIAQINIDADHTGAITTSLPFTANYQLFRNNVDQTTSSSWSVTKLSGTGSVSIGAATGILSINTSGGVLTSLLLEISAAYGGKTRKQKVVVNVKNALPPTYGSSGGSANGGGFSGFTGGGTTLVGPVLEFPLVIAGSGNATLNAAYMFSNGDTPGSGPWEVVTQFARHNGSGWTLIGSPTPSGGYIPGFGFPGSGSANFTDTGRTPGSAVRYGLFIADNGSSPSTGNSLSGTFSGQS